MFGDIHSDLKFTEDISSEYKANLEMVLKSQLLKRIIARSADDEYLVCMNIIGALR